MSEIHAVKGIFYLSVQNAGWSSKRILVGVKISTNLQRSSVRGTLVLSPVIAVAGLIQILLHTKADCQLVYFLSDVKQLTVSPQMSLADICKEVAKASVPVSSAFKQSVMQGPRANLNLSSHYGKGYFFGNCQTGEAEVWHVGFSCDDIFGIQCIFVKQLEKLCGI